MDSFLLSLSYLPRSFDVIFLQYLHVTLPFFHLFFIVCNIENGVPSGFLPHVSWLRCF